MSYTLFIQRFDAEGNPSEDGITLEEWLAVANTTQSIRITGKKDLYGNGSKYDAELYNSGSQEWVRIFAWNIDQIRIPEDGGFGDSSFPVKEKMLELANKLGAKVVGEGGEIYDEEFFTKMGL
jgi:hypothetical protein